MTTHLKALNIKFEKIEDIFILFFFSRKIYLYGIECALEIPIIV